MRSSDIVARLGGDEFAIILKNAQEQQVLGVAEQIRAKLCRPFNHGGRTVDCRASVGAAVFPRDGATAEQLLKCADIALYTSKAAGGGLPVLYQPDMEHEPKQLAETLALARKLLRTRRIFVHYQPKVNLFTGQISGFEALLRWKDRSGAMRDAAHLAAAFEDPALACEIGEVIQQLVLRDMRQWLDAGVRFGEVAINVTDPELRDGTYHERLLRSLDAHDIPTALLKIEVTERVLLGKGAKTAERSLRELSGAGVRIALDDFGTGYASLAHLKLVPVDELKIDASFIRDFADAESMAIVRALLTLGTTLGIAVVAEGVETAAQAAMLRDEGCRLAQGFLFSPAVPPERTAELIAATRQPKHKAGGAQLSAAA